MSTAVKIAVQNALIAAAVAGEFHPVTYDATTRLAAVDLVATEAPVSVVANEVSSVYAVASSYRRHEARERRTWTWELHLGFKKEVLAENFEKACTNEPIRVKHDEAAKIDTQVTLEITDVRYTHPATQDPGVGSTVKYTFNARMRPL